jgi:energy-coupling factor transport system ATP-binding protein
MIDLKNVCYRYDGSPDDAIHNINLEVAEGSFIALMGANGSGKSTLAKCLNGLLLPTSGDVLVDGMSTLDEDSLLAIRRKVGFVFQDPGRQMTSPTVERELAFGLQNIGLPTDALRARVAGELKRLHLETRSHLLPSKLSGGEQIRLALAATMLLEPQYLVLDEPTSFLSPTSRRLLLAELLAFQDSRRMSIVLVTQFLAEAMKADRLIILAASRIVFDAPPVEALSEAAHLGDLGIVVPSALRPPS